MQVPPSTGVRHLEENWLFAGSDKGGRTAATLFTLIASAALHELDPYRWLRDALSRIADTPISQLDELLPDRWAGSSTD
ncbi:MAG: transposase domain-containing protein [Planctomycetes bacterium]|nr:transposase domain-containing protein [Planctomycetota bacterium]